jgi:hypothetical protein
LQKIPTLYSFSSSIIISGAARPHPVFVVAVEDAVQFFIGETIAELAMPDTGSMYLRYTPGRNLATPK